MPRKCSVIGCRSGYNPTKKKKNTGGSGADSQKETEETKVKVHCFPSDKEQCQRWINALPNNNITVEKVTAHMGVCIKHWPPETPKKFRGRSMCPTEPPSVFSSQIPTSKLKLSSTSSKSQILLTSNLPGKLLGVQPGSQSEIDEKKATDKISDFTSFCAEANHYLPANEWTYELGDVKEGQEFIQFILLQDLPRLEESRYLFKVTVFSDMSIKLFSHMTGDIPNRSLSWIFGNEDKPPVLEYWTQFVTLVSQCSTGVWVDGNEDNQRVCIITDLHKLFPGEGNEKSAPGDDMIQDEKSSKILGMTQELYKVIFQRNQLIKKMQSLQDLANINLDLLNSIMEINMNPEGKTELDKVSKLVQTIMIDSEMGGGLDILPLLVTQYWNLMENDNPFQRKPPYVPNNLSGTKRAHATGEMYGDSSTEDGNTGGQSLLGEGQSHLSGTKSKKDDNLKTNTCEFCGKKFSKSGPLNQHIWMKHTRGLPPELLLDCTICGKRFKKPSRLKFHINIHHTDNRPFQCFKCGKTFKCNPEFKRHMRCVHSEEKPFKCSVCDKRFKRKDFLRHHERAHLKPKIFGNKVYKRGEDNRFHCDTCNKGFIFSSDLRKHITVHSDQKEFKCTVCEKLFKSYTGFRRHVRTAHSEDTPYQCSLCPKKFKLKSRLTCHQLVHTDREPFKCTVCDKTFKWLRSLQKHQVVHSQNAPGNQSWQEQEIQRHQVVHSQRPQMVHSQRHQMIHSQRHQMVHSQRHQMVHPQNMPDNQSWQHLQRSNEVTEPGMVISGDIVTPLLDSFAILY